MSKTKAEMKTEIKDLLANADYTSDEERDNWLELLEDLNWKELKEVYRHFSKLNKIKEVYAMKLIYEEGLEDEYKDELENISNKHKKRVLGKKEKRERDAENPDNLLNELNNIK